MTAQRQAPGQAPADREGPPAGHELAAANSATRGGKREAAAAAPIRRLHVSLNRLRGWLDFFQSGNFGEGGYFGQFVGAALGIAGVAALLAVAARDGF